MRWGLLTALIFALILVPFFLFEPQFNALSVRLTESDASRVYVALGIGALLTSDVFLPIPSSLVSAAAGVLLGFWPGALVIWAGMTGACVFGYGFGFRASRAAERFVGADSLARAAKLAKSHGDFAVVLCRPVPVLAEASVILAGLVGAKFRRFFLLTTAANFGTALAYAAVGVYSMQVESLLVAFGGAILVPALAMLVFKLWTGPGPTSNPE